MADALDENELSASALAEALQVHEEHLFRLLRMLAALGIFEQTAPRTFRNNKTSHHLRAAHPQSVRAMVLMHNSPEMTAPWLAPLEEAIRDGGVPFAKVHGSDLFDYMDDHREFDLLFGSAMDAVENLTGTDYLADFDWSAFGRIIDIGGSKGAKTAAILRENPKLEAVVFDRPQIMDAARAESAQLAPELRERMTFEGGDMFDRIPPATSNRDLYLFVAIFHGMADEECLTVLNRLKTAAGGHAPTAVFVDMVMPEVGADATTASFDMQMLVNTRGRERTEAEWRTLLERAEFALEAVLPVRTFAKFVVARPS